MAFMVPRGTAKLDSAAGRARGREFDSDAGGLVSPAKFTWELAVAGRDVRQFGQFRGLLAKVDGGD